MPNSILNMSLVTILREKSTYPYQTTTQLKMSPQITNCNIVPKTSKIFNVSKISKKTKITLIFFNKTKKKFKFKKKKKKKKKKNNFF
jgi:phosphorylcholine metabolism protein LicD